MPTTRLPRAFLTLPGAGDRTLLGLLRKVRLLGVRALLTSGRPELRALQRRVQRGLEEDGPAELERAGAMDVLPRLLCLAGRVLPAEACADGLEDLYLGRRVVASRAVDDALELALEDTNPLADQEAHPDKDGNALSLGGRPEGDWLVALREARDTVAVALPEWGPQAAVLRRVVPVGWDEREHRSASYKEAPGLAYASLHPDPLTMAEALVHETQHSCLNLLAHFDPLLQGDPGVRVASPVRPDPRPLHGVLLAAHAFVPVAALHLRLAETDHPWSREGRFPDRRREVLRKNADAIVTLDEHAHPTALGARVLDGLRAVQRAAEAACDPLR